VEIIRGVELSRPASLSVPLGFLACYLGTILSGPERKAERGFEELHVRSETGLGAEVAVKGAGLSGGGDESPVEREPEQVPASSRT
jgi:hypothetical protein